MLSLIRRRNCRLCKPCLVLSKLRICLSELFWLCTNVNYHLKSYMALPEMELRPWLTVLANNEMRHLRFSLCDVVVVVSAMNFIKSRPVQGAAEWGEWFTFVMCNGWIAHIVLQIERRRKNISWRWRENLPWNSVIARGFVIWPSWRTFPNTSQSWTSSSKVSTGLSALCFTKWNHVKQN